MSEHTDSLKVAEHFYSVQGEGQTVGTPSVFLRLSMCNFSCTFCDTVDVWTKGTRMSFDELDKMFEDSSYYSFMQKRNAHLVLTGGDPLIQQENLVGMFRRMAEFERQPERFFVEVETQGYIQPSKEFVAYVRQWNVSPKLANSGMPESKRINLDILNWHANTTSCFKFPVTTFEDLKEVESIVRKTKIKRSRVFLMPIASTRAAYEALSKEVARFCLMSGFRFGQRLHLFIWDRAVGV